MNSGIYLITNIENNKVYVGKASNLCTRFIQHRSALNLGKHSNPHLQQAWKLYGEASFVFEIIERVPNRLLHERELYWIHAYAALDSGIGYNAMCPNDALKIFGAPKENRNKITRVSLTKVTKDKISKSLTGHPVSTATIEKISKTWYFKGRKMPDAEVQKLRARMLGKVRFQKTYSLRNPEGKIVSITNLNKFCREHNLNQGNMVQVANGKKRICCGWTAGNV